MAAPDVRYAQNAGISIAYQVFGSGPRDLVFVCGTMSHLELWWSDPAATTMLEGLASFSRVILFDKPGTGMSDPVPAAPTVEQRANDIEAVMDAVGAERATLVGYSEGGFPSMLLSATRPERVDALVLLSTMVTTEWAPDIAVAPERFGAVWAVLDAACDSWGEGILMEAFSPTWAANPTYKRLLPSIERTCMSPGMARSVLQGLHDVDLREVAAAIRVPTLVLHAPEKFIPQGLGRDLAERIRGAQFVELVGPDHLTWTHNCERFPAEVERFVTGEERGPREADRVLTTIVFTDIVDSTRHLGAMGDARWRTVLAEHDRRMDELLDRFEGTAVKHTGDGRLAHFSRPARAVRFAAAMVEAASQIGLEIRAGIHTGECDVVDGDLFGMAVNIGARLAAIAGPGDVLASSTVKDLVIGSSIVLAHHGDHELKGVPGTWAVHRYVGDLPGAPVGAGYDVDERHRTDEPGRSPRARDRALLGVARTAPGSARRALRLLGPARKRSLR
ncbi:MAG: alpha/beta fold hydrolase [Acidimicrobiales bacterium]